MKKIVLLLALVATFAITTSCKDREVEETTETVDTTTVVTPSVDNVETTTTVEVDTLSTE